MKQQGSILITRYPDKRHSIHSRLGYTELIHQKSSELDKYYIDREAIYEAIDFQPMITKIEKSDTDEDSDVEIIASHAWTDVKRLPKGFKYLPGQKIKYGGFKLNCLTMVHEYILE